MNPLSDISDITKKLSILIVEDDPDVRNFLVLALTPYFNKILQAGDGMEGLDVFKQSNIDLIISDHEMPKLKGIDMVREIRSVNQDIPVIMITAYTDSVILIEAINLGVNQFLIKPVGIETLYRSVSLALAVIIARHKAIVEQEYKILKVKEDFNILQKRLALKKQQALIKNDIYYKKLLSSDNKTWLINTKYKPFDIVSGDFYSIRYIDNKGVLITLMDAVGKGLSAFVSSSVVMAYLNYYIDKHKHSFNHLEFIKSVHDYIIRQLDEDEAFCILFMFIDYSQDVVELINFGMPPVFIVTTDRHLHKICQDCMPICNEQDVEIIQKIPIHMIEKILLMSDGVYEPHLEDILTSSLIQSPFKSVFIKNILSHIESSQDDVSIVFIRSFGIEPKWSKELVIDAKLNSVHELISDVELILTELGLDIQFVVESTTAINEMVMNAYEHGSLSISRAEKNRLLKDDIYEETLIEMEKTIDKKINLRLSWYNEDLVDYFTFTIKDEGKGFDTMIIKDTIVDLESLNFRGIKITKGLVDEIYYNNVGNEVLLIKRNNI